MAQKRPQFDDATVEVLMEIVEWWKTRKLENEMSIEPAPKFIRKKTATRSVRLDNGMLEAAEKKARKDRAGTGGTFNGLIEVLVWRYLGCPSKYIE